MELGNNVKELRKKRGLSQCDLAIKAGVSRAAVRDLENGYKDPLLSTLYAIAGALQVSLSFLMRGYGVHDASSVVDNRDRAA